MARYTRSSSRCTHFTPANQSQATGRGRPDDGNGRRQPRAHQPAFEIGHHDRSDPDPHLELAGARAPTHGHQHTGLDQQFLGPTLGQTRPLPDRPYRRPDRPRFDPRIERCRTFMTSRRSGEYPAVRWPQCIGGRPASRVARPNDCGPGPSSPLRGAREAGAAMGSAARVHRGRPGEPTRVRSGGTPRDRARRRRALAASGRGSP